MTQMQSLGYIGFVWQTRTQYRPKAKAGFVRWQDQRYAGWQGTRMESRPGDGILTLVCLGRFTRGASLRGYRATLFRHHIAYSMCRHLEYIVPSGHVVTSVSDAKGAASEEEHPSCLEPTPRGCSIRVILLCLRHLYICRSFNPVFSIRYGFVVAGDGTRFCYFTYIRPPSP